MKSDGRSPERIQRAIEESRKAFNDIEYLVIVISDYSVSESVKEIINRAKL